MEYYESRQPGLGLDFLQEIDSSIETIRNAPERRRLHDDGTRRDLPSRFPYLVVYLCDEELIWILALAHCKRRPRYWADRIRSAE